MLTCFLDISKAFDTVWHAKLLQKLKTAGVSPGLYKFVQSFLSNRSMAVKWKGITTASKKTDMGVPQGTVIAPLLFSILIANIGEKLGKNTTITAYADDVALWRTTKVRRPKKTSGAHKREVRLFQSDVDNVVHALEDNGFTLSPTKTVYMPVHLPGFKYNFPAWNHLNINGKQIPPSTSVKYLGVTFNSKGLWSQHVNGSIAKARRALNLVRAIRHESWGQRRETLVHIVQSLIRSRLLYGAQALHDLPLSTIQKMAAVECTALRLALGLSKGVPQRAVYNEAGILPLWHRLKRDACSYIFRSNRAPNSTDQELDEKWVPHRQGSKYQGIAESVRTLCESADLFINDREDLALTWTDGPPPWEQTSLDVSSSLPGLTKKDSPNLLAARARELISETYPNHFRIFTDGSVQDDGSTGAGVYLQPLRTSIYIKLAPTTILTAELTAINIALKRLCDMENPPPHVCILTDSKSCLDILELGQSRSRPEILEDILTSADTLTDQGVSLKFQWVPSHVGIHGNEMADRAAKKGAQKSQNSSFPLIPSINDFIRKIDQASWRLWQEEYESIAIAKNWVITECSGNSKETHFSSQPPHIAHLMSRIRTNCWPSKYIDDHKAPLCVCGIKRISFKHCLFECPNMTGHFRPIRERYVGHNDPLTLLRRVSKTGNDGWTPLIQAATLTHSSPVAAYL